jgi:hypothetical protein
MQDADKEAQKALAKIEDEKVSAALLPALLLASSPRARASAMHRRTKFWSWSRTLPISLCHWRNSNTWSSTTGWSVPSSVFRLPPCSRHAPCAVGLCRVVCTGRSARHGVVCRRCLCRLEEMSGWQQQREPAFCGVWGRGRFTQKFDFATHAVSASLASRFRESGHCSIHHNRQQRTDRFERRVCTFERTPRHRTPHRHER